MPIFLFIGGSMGILEDIRKRKIESILRNREYFFEHDLLCPYCGREQEDLWGCNLGYPNGEEEEFQCQKCERHFAFKMDIVFSGRALK